MANFMTVSLDCRSEELRRTLTELLGAHRDVFVKQATGLPVDLLILELDEHNPSRTFSQIRSISGSKPQTEIALAVSRVDPQIMLEAFRLGVKELFASPLNRQEVDQAMSRFRERYKARVPANPVKQGQVISVIGSKGGIGTTTAVVNLAASLQQMDRNKSTGLLDLNFQGSDLPLFLDISPNGGLRDLSEDLSRLDETILRTVLAKHSSGLQILASGHDGVIEGVPPANSVLHILDLMKALFNYVVVDCGHSINTATKEAFEVSTVVHVLTVLNVPAIRRAKRLIDYLRGSLEEPEKIVLAINRYHSKDEALLAQAEELLRLKATWLIPNNYMVASHALDTGSPFVVLNGRSDIAKSYLKKAMTYLDNKQESDAGAQPKQQDSRKSSLLTRYLPNLPVIG